VQSRLLSGSAQHPGVRILRLRGFITGVHGDGSVAHSVSMARGSFIQTLALTDIATGWTEERGNRGLM
jgi:hypothetical protein